MDIKQLLGMKKPDIKKMEREKDIKGLMKLISFENDEAVRREAAFVIGKITDSTVEPYKNTSNNETHDPVNHNCYVEDLNVEQLVNSLNDKNRENRNKAASSLVKIGEPAGLLLVDALHDDDWHVRWHAAEVLGEIGDIRAVKPLTDVLNDENEDVRLSATRALEKIQI